MNAEQFVREGLTACLPPGVPLMGRILSARWTGKQTAEANMEMFDGATETVEVSLYAPFTGAWHTRWQDDGQGDINWNGSTWERIAPVQVQMTLFD